MINTDDNFHITKPTDNLDQKKYSYYGTWTKLEYPMPQDGATKQYVDEICKQINNTIKENCEHYTFENENDYFYEYCIQQTKLLEKIMINTNKYSTNIKLTIDGDDK